MVNPGVRSARPAIVINIDSPEGAVFIPLVPELVGMALLIASISQSLNRALGQAVQGIEAGELGTGVTIHVTVPPLKHVCGEIVNILVPQRIIHAFEDFLHEVGADVVYLSLEV